MQPADTDKVVLYAEIPREVKERMEDLARQHNRKLTGEVTQALQDYLERHNLWPPSKS